LDKISPKIVDWKQVNISPDNTFKRTENCNYVLLLCHKLGLSMKGICGKDIEEGRENLTLALLGQLMRYDIFNFLKNLKYQGKEVTEAFMVDWANSRVRTYTRFRLQIPCHLVATYMISTLQQN
jgi:hypothetical protein